MHVQSRLYSITSLPIRKSIPLHMIQEYEGDLKEIESSITRKRKQRAVLIENEVAEAYTITIRKTSQ